MTSEFKKIKDNTDTRYVLETATSGGTSAGAIASVPGGVGKVQKRGNLLAQEEKKEAPKPRNFVAKNAKMGGAGQHKDKKKAVKQGNAKHKKPFMEGEDGEEQGYTLGKVLPFPDFIKQLSATLRTSNLNWKMTKRDDSVFLFSAPNDHNIHNMLMIAVVHNGWVSATNGVVYPDGQSSMDDKQELPMTVASVSEIAQGAIQSYHSLDLSDYADDLGEQGMAEGDNSEYDDEAGMAHSNLFTTARAVMGLLKTIEDKDNLPEWVQEKIAKAEMMLVGVWDYLQSQKEQGIDPKVEGYGRYDRRDAYQRDYDHSVAGMDRGNNHRDDERHDLDPSDWYIVKDGKMYKTSVYPRQEQEAMSRGYSRTREEAKAKASEQSVAEGVSDYQKVIRQGTKAHLAGKTELTNPYSKGTEEHKTWYTGWKLSSRRNEPSGRTQQGVAEGLGKDIKRLATGKDVKSRAGQEIAKSQDASMKGDNKTSKKHFDRYDKLDKLANKEHGVAEGDTYIESWAEKLAATADVGDWVTDFKAADPNKYHQFKNKTDIKKQQMAVAAYYDSKQPKSKKK